MAQFHFQGRNAQGQAVSGTRAGESAEGVGKQLLLEGITPVTITAVKAKINFLDTIPFLKIISTDELLIFCQQMTALLRAGIPLLNAIERVSDSVNNKKFKEILYQVAQDVAKGSSLSKALSRYPKLFTPIVCNLIRVGEESGNLVEIFQQLVDYLAFEDLTHKRILAALRYPTTVVIVVILALTIINIFVIPVFSQLYAGFHVTLPLPTRILIGMSDLMRHHGIELAIAIILFIFIFRYYAKTENGKYFLGKMILKMPIFGDLIKRMLLARFSRTLGLIYRSGIPLIEGLKLVAESNTNLYVQKTVLTLRDAVINGEKFSTAAAKVPLFSSTMTQMITVGEESGSLDNMLFQVASYYETTIDFEVKRLADRMEPILLIIVGGIVLVLALGVFMPMWNIINIVKMQ